MSTFTLSLTDLRPRLSETIDRAQKVFDRFIITRHGRAEAVLLALDDYEGLLETLDILSDQELVRGMAEAEAEFARGGGRDLDDIEREIAAERGNGESPALRTG